MCLEEQFEKNDFFWKFFLFYRFGTMSDFVFDVSVKSFLQCCQNYIFSVRRNVSRKGIFFGEKQTFSSIFDFERKNWPNLAEIFWHSRQNCVLRIQTNILRKNGFF